MSDACTCIGNINKAPLNKYYDACNELLKLFCEKHDFDYEDAKNSWVSGHIGETVCCGDFFFNMDVIVTDLKENALKEELLKWYDYNLECVTLGTNGCSYPSWLKRCPILTEEQLEDLRRLRKEVERAKKELEECVDRYKKAGL